MLPLNTCYPTKYSSQDQQKILHAIKFKLDTKINKNKKINKTKHARNITYLPYISPLHAIKFKLDTKKQQKQENK